MQFKARQCKAMQFHAKQCSATQGKAQQCNAIQQQHDASNPSATYASTLSKQRNAILRQCSAYSSQPNAVSRHTMHNSSAIHAKAPGRAFPITISPHDGFSLVSTLRVARPHMFESYMWDNTEQCHNAKLNMHSGLMQSVIMMHSKQVP